MLHGFGQHVNIGRVPYVPPGRHSWIFAAVIWTIVAVILVVLGLVWKWFMRD